jgi:toxin FitB
VSGSDPAARAASLAIQVSFLIDTDLLSLLERKQAPAKLENWVRRNEADIFLSVVSFAELQFGLDHAPATHKASLGAWLADLRQKLAPATEELTEPVLVRWKELLAELKVKNRTMTCEDSLIAATALFHGHTVATRNKRHFEPAGVQIADPLA